MTLAHLSVMKSKSAVDQIIGTGAPILDMSKANSRDEMMHAYKKNKRRTFLYEWNW